MKRGTTGVSKCCQWGFPRLEGHLGGSIVLFHNAGEHTPEALPDILDYLLAEGYKIVPISKILLTCDYTIDHEGRQCPAVQ